MINPNQDEPCFPRESTRSFGSPSDAIVEGWLFGDNLGNPMTSTSKTFSKMKSGNGKSLSRRKQRRQGRRQFSQPQRPFHQSQGLQLV